MSSNKIFLVYSDTDGHLRVDSQLMAVGMNGGLVEVADQTWIDLPAGSELVLLPGRLPLGYNEQTDDLEVVETATAVAAILPVGMTRCLTPGYEIEIPGELPLFGYTAVGSQNGRLKVAAIKTDDELKWNPAYYNTSDLARLVEKKKQEFPENRILKQVGKCALEYHCLTAQNIFYSRWEAGIPVSPQCNADCLGCISLQPAECCPSPQSRIDFVPTVQEVAELGIFHLTHADGAIISFGQGCEGEPSLQRDLLAESIRQIRRYTDKGRININTNAGWVDSIKELIDAGLDSIRVSLFSAVEQNYRWYHRPRGYGLGEVKQSLNYAADHGLMVALNLLLFPGFSNKPQETEALYELVAETGVRQIQLRNLNLDPEKMVGLLGKQDLPTINEWLNDLKRHFPKLLIGNYTLAK